MAKRWLHFFNATCFEMAVIFRAKCFWAAVSTMGSNWWSLISLCQEISKASHRGLKLNTNTEEIIVNIPAFWDKKKLTKKPNNLMLLNRCTRHLITEILVVFVIMWMCLCSWYCIKLHLTVVSKGFHRWSKKKQVQTSFCGENLAQLWRILKSSQYFSIF